MSRGAEAATGATAGKQNAGYYAGSQNSYSQAQNDVGDYQDQLAKYAASNPYVEGGQFQKTTNQVLANTSDAGARAAGDALQAQSLRTGQNSAGAVAATERMQQQGTRDLSAEEAKANQERIGAGAEFNKGVLGATAVPAQLETTLAGQQGQLAEGALGTAQKANAQPGFWDEFGQAFAKNAGGTLGKQVG